MDIQNSEMRSIIFITASLGKGGAERVVTELANHLSDNGFEIKIIILCYDEIVYELDDRVKIINLAKEIKINNGLDLLFKRAHVLRNYIKNTCTKNEVYIAFQDYVANISCLAMIGLKNFLVVSERNDPLKSTLANKILKKILYFRANGFVFQTEDAKSCFSKRIRNRSTVIANPIRRDLPKIEKVNRNKEIIAVGRLTSQKNHIFLVKAFEKIILDYPDATLVIYGEGEIKDKIDNFILIHGIKNVRIMNFTNEIHSKIADANIFVMPSIFEGMPNSLMEAMAIGVPVIATNCRCGGPRELIEDSKYGVLINVNDEKALVESIIKIFNDQEYSENLRAAEQERMQSYLIDEISNKWIEFINSLEKING